MRWRDQAPVGHEWVHVVVAPNPRQSDIRDSEWLMFVRPTHWEREFPNVKPDDYHWFAVRMSDVERVKYADFGAFSVHPNNPLGAHICYD